MLWPASYQAGYLPETWRLDGCEGRLGTVGFKGFILELQAQTISTPSQPRASWLSSSAELLPPSRQKPVHTEKIELRVPHELPPFRIGRGDECRLARQTTGRGLDTVKVDCRRPLNGLELRFPGGEFADIPGAELKGILRPRQLLPNLGKRLKGRLPPEVWYCSGQCDDSANWARASRRGEYFSAPAVDDWATRVRVRLVWPSKGVRYFMSSSLFELSRKEELAFGRLSPWGGRFRFPAPKARFETSGGILLPDTCRLHRGKSNWTLDCDDAPDNQLIEIKGYRQGETERPADILILKVRGPKKVVLESHVRHFYLSPLRLPLHSLLMPLSLVQGKSTWPCTESEITPPVYRCDVQNPAGTGRYGVHVKRGEEEAQQQATLRPGAIRSLEDLFVREPLAIDPSFPQGRDPADWNISVFTNRNCTTPTATEDARAKAGQFVRATHRDDANRYSECLTLAARDLTLVDGRLARKIRFAHLRRRIPRPETMPWQSDYRIQWDSLPPGCRGLSGKSGLLACDDNLSVPKAGDWPRLIMTNAEGAPVLTATLDLSNPGQPRLVDPRYAILLQGPADIRPRLGSEGECIRDKEVWRCEIPELKISRLILTSSDSSGDPFPYEIAERTLTPTKVYDWTRWLPELPLQWAGAGDLDLAYPPTHWRDLLIWSRLGCGDRQGPRLVPLTRFQRRDFSVKAPVGGSVRIAQRRGGRQTTCTSLDKKALRLGTQGLELAFAPEQERTTRQADQRRILIIDVSVRMRSMAGDLLRALKAYNPSPQSAKSLVLMADSPRVEVHAEDLDPAAYRTALGRLRFNRYPEDAFTFIALGLSPFEGSRGHQVRVLFSYPWVDATSGQYSIRSLGFLNQILGDQAIESPVDLFLLEATEGDCTTLLDNWPRDRLGVQFTCHPWTTSQLGILLRGK